MKNIQVFIDFEALSKCHSRIFLNHNYNCDLPFCYSIKIQDSKTYFFKIQYIIDFAPNNLKQQFKLKNKNDLLSNIKKIIKINILNDELEKNIQFIVWNGILEEKILKDYFNWNLDNDTFIDVGLLLKKNFKSKTQIGLDKITYFKFKELYFDQSLNFINTLEKSIKRKIIFKKKYGEIASAVSLFCFFYNDYKFNKKIKSKILQYLNIYFDNYYQIDSFKKELKEYNINDVEKLYWITKNCFNFDYKNKLKYNFKNILILKDIYELNTQYLLIERKINKLNSEFSEFKNINTFKQNLNSNLKKIKENIKNIFKTKIKELINKLN